MSQVRLVLDVRTKLGLILLANLFLLNGSETTFLKEGILVAFFLGLFILNGTPKKAYTYGLLFLAVFFLAHLSEVVPASFFLIQRTAAFCWLVLLLYPTILAGSLLIHSTEVSLLFQGFDQLHIPRQLALPFVVMLRFIPHFITEFKTVAKMLRLRRTAMHGWHRLRIDFYFIPLLNTAIRSAENLAKAAYARGLSVENKRTHYRKNHPTFRDALVLLSAAIIIFY